MPMLIRRWHSEIAPLELSKERNPVWIEFKGIPLELMSPEGVS
ncbi:hypothetical protein LINPERPRIM_LOCUS22433 [Linum perenne]